MYKPLRTVTGIVSIHDIKVGAYWGSAQTKCHTIAIITHSME